MSGRFSKQLLSRLNQSLDIVQLISKHVQLKRNGNRYLGLCPFHNEKTPSFVVTPEKNLFYCFGCHEHGGPIDFHMKINQISFPESIRQIAKDLGITIDDNHNSEYECLDLIAKWCMQNLNKQPAILKQLTDRNVNEDCIKIFKLGFMPSIYPNALCKILNCKLETLIKIGIVNSENNANRFRQRIIFPICDQYGQIIAFGGRSIQSNQQPKYINSPETVHFKKNSIIYNFHQAKKQGCFILVEGYMDVIKLHRHGFTNAVAFMGTSFNEERLQNLINSAQKLYICYDGDSAGQTATDKISMLCLKHLGPQCEMNIIRLPNNHDPDSYVDKHGSHAFEKLINEAKSLSEDLIEQLAVQTPLNRTINKSRFKQNFLKLAETIHDSIFKKDFKDLGFKLLYGNQPFNKTPKINVEKGAFNWIDRIMYLIASKPACCHELSKEDIEKLLSLKTVKQMEFKFIGYMVNTIINENILTIDELINRTQKKQTVEKLKQLQNKHSYLSNEDHILELQSSISKLMVEKNKFLSQELINKSKQSELTPEERKKLISLIKNEKTV
ncbi:MAG: DNA primase [Pseudomonadota bacterium]|nr:DNA primase [Pseudomonadota bacterium]